MGLGDANIRLRRRCHPASRYRPYALSLRAIGSRRGHRPPPLARLARAAGIYAPSSHAIGSRRGHICSLLSHDWLAPQASAEPALLTDRAHNDDMALVAVDNTDYNDENVADENTPANHTAAPLALMPAPGGWHSRRPQRSPYRQLWSP
eukprot:2172136-Pyramimonas_sp.AAC.1